MELNGGSTPVLQYAVTEYTYSTLHFVLVLLRKQDKADGVRDLVVA